MQQGKKGTIEDGGYGGADAYTKPHNRRIGA